MADATLGSTGDRYAEADRLFAFAAPALILVYLACVFFAFDIPGLAERARWDNGVTRLSDTWSHKTHVTRDNRTGAVKVAIEGEKKGIYPEGAGPDRVEHGPETTVIDLGDRHFVPFLPDNALS